MDFQSIKLTSLFHKIFMEIRSKVIVWLGEPLLVLGRGLRSTDEFKNVMVTSFILDASLVKYP